MAKSATKSKKSPEASEDAYKQPSPPATPPGPAADFPKAVPGASAQSSNLDKLLDDITKAQNTEVNKPKVNDAATVVAKMPESAPSRDQMLAELAAKYGTTPDEVAKLLRVDAGVVTRPAPDPTPLADRPLPDGTQLFPVELTHEYWAGKQIADQWPVPPEPGSEGNNRCAVGMVLRLPIDEAMRLIEHGKAKRADRMSTTLMQDEAAH